MKRVAGLVVLALLAFYGAWPAWNGYRIRAAIENQDAALLESKIAFDEVRASLKPVVKAEVDRNVERALKDAGPLGGLIGNQLKGDLANRMVESAINSIVTPVNVIKIAHDGKNLREAIERVLAEQMGGIFGGGKTAGTGEGKPAGGSGGLGGILEKLGQRRPQASSTDPQPSTNPSSKTETRTDPADGPALPAKRRYGLANIKRVKINGPLSFSVGVARQADETEPDVTAEMRFTGFDWKVVSLIPRLDR